MWDRALTPVPGDVVACLTELGVAIKRINYDEVEGYCPAHLERLGKPDLKSKWAVNTETGMHNCFSCGFRGPFVGLVRYLLRCTPEEAAAWVRARGSIEHARRKLGMTEELPTRTGTLDEITEADLALFTEVPPDVCHTRHLTPRAADHYGVLWDPVNRYWITPIRDPHTGKLWGWQEKGPRHFRNVPPRLKKSDTLFGIHQLTGDTTILVESPLDCLRIYDAGIYGAVSSFGASVSDAQLNLLCARVNTLIVALDNDEPGHDSSRHMHRRIAGRVRVKFWNYGITSAKDPGEQTDEEIRSSYSTAYSSILARW